MPETKPTVKVTGHGKYGILAYGKAFLFTSKKKYTDFLNEWMAGTEGSERDRAVEAYKNLLRGLRFFDSDGNPDRACSAYRSSEAWVRRALEDGFVLFWGTEAKDE